MGYDKSKPATRQEPCVICGKTDHCWSAYHSKGGWLHYCAGAGGDSAVFGRDGRKYLLKNNRAFPGGMSGGYYVYEAEEQQQQNLAEYIAERKASNPNYKYYGANQSVTQAPVPVEEKERIHVDHVNPLPNKKLHEIYSYLLQLLVLEDHHRDALLKEWNAGLVDPALGNRLLENWPVRSLPMNDQARKACGVKLKNMTRRQIIRELVERFGSLKGVPGFFYETIRWTDKHTGEERVSSHWQMAGTSGIVYPCYDTDGYIYRIRIGDEHPVLCEYARDAGGNYLYKDHTKRVLQSNGKWGLVVEKRHVISADYRWDYRTGEWYREDRLTKERTLVYSLQKNVICKMSAKGYPIIDGKVDGKYKNFSSYKEREVEQDGKVYIYNTYPEGCQSESPLTLYTKPGDDMRFVYVTEGEKKAMVINAFLNCPVVSLPGVNTFRKLFENEYQKDKSVMQWLVEMGLEAVIIVYDADKTTNDAVLNAEKGALEKCREYGLLTFVAEWDARYGKGSDDILIAGKKFEFYER